MTSAISSRSVTFTHRQEKDGRVKSAPIVKIEGKPEHDQRSYVIDSPFLRLGGGRLELIRNHDIVLQLEP